MKVVNLRNETYDLYIGRENKTFGLKASKWANPFTLDEFTREDSLIWYEDYIRRTELYDDLEELTGLTLGCWCKPKECHGDVLIRLYNEKEFNKFISEL